MLDPLPLSQESCGDSLIRWTLPDGEAPTCTSETPREALKRSRPPPVKTSQKRRRTDQPERRPDSDDASCEAPVSPRVAAAVPWAASTPSPSAPLPPAAPDLSLSCGESDVFSEGASNGYNDGDHEACAQSPRRRSPTPAVSAPRPNPPLRQAEPSRAFDPDMMCLLHALRASEKDAPLDPGYLDSHHGPSVLNPGFIDVSMRRMCASWMVEVAAEFRLSQDALHLAISSLDRFLSVTRAVPHTQLQLVAVACLLTAAKHEEETHPSMSDLINIAANCFTLEDLLQMEGILLSTLRFRMAAPTSHTFLSVLRGLLGLSPAVHSLAAYVIELAALECSMLDALPSVVAAGAVAMAAAHHRDVSALQGLAQLLPEAKTEVAPCVRRLRTVHSVAQRECALATQHTPYYAIRDKFAREEWRGASLEWL